MRGKGYLEPFYSIYHRITPAYAGKSTAFTILSIKNPDHPRLCGEKLVTSGNSGVGLGSPPPMRGKAETFAVADLFVGITPAYAGKSRNDFPNVVKL